MDRTGEVDFLTSKLTVAVCALPLRPISDRQSVRFTFKYRLSTARTWPYEKS